VVPKKQQKCLKKNYDEFLNTVVLSLLLLLLLLLLSIGYKGQSSSKAPADSVVEAMRSTGVVAIGFCVLGSNRYESKETLFGIDL
jgi:hypothetical protein